MATRIVYVHPGDLIEIRVINDEELPRTAIEWRYQVRPEKILLQYKGYQRIACADPAVYFDHTFIGRDAYGAPTPPAPQEVERAPAIAPAADAYRDCCDTPSLCSAVRRCTAKDSAQSPSQGEMDAGAVTRTEQMIVDQTEQLAAALAKIDGYQLAGNYRDTSAPRGRAYWIKACLAQEILTSTDPENAVAELGDPNQPEASADKLALTEGQMRTLQRAANALECCEYEDTAGDLRAIIATLKGQQR